LPAGIGWQGGVEERLKGRKVFFSTKKQQKTLESCGALAKLARAPQRKSFLVLFFKKEPLSVCP
jgi:hypothetical protein